MFAIQKIRHILNELKNDKNKVILHSTQVHRLIKKGFGSCSSDRYIRLLRELGEIYYEDPRKNKFIYEIKLKKNFFKSLKRRKNEKRNIKK